MQEKLSTAEIAHTETQLVASRVREAIVDLEITHHQVQTDNAKELDNAMNVKFSNSIFMTG